MQEKIKHRWSPTLGQLEDTAEKIWGTEQYDPYLHNEEPTVFFGLYGLPDFYVLWRHKGKKWLLWTGSDIRHFDKGYFLDRKGKIRIHPTAFAEWINKYCENWVENEVEVELLAQWNIKAKVCPSFLGDVNKFQITYKWNERPKVYASVSGDDFKLYEWDVIERAARKVPGVDFYLYGNTKEWKTKNKNVFVKGRVPKEQMNVETDEMQAGFRPLRFDGCSEIIVKAVLRGQYVISRIGYPYIKSFDSEKELVEQLKELTKKKKPNLKARDWFIKNLNKYPWVK